MAWVEMEMEMSDLMLSMDVRGVVAVEEVVVEAEEEVMVVRCCVVWLGW